MWMARLKGQLCVCYRHQSVRPSSVELRSVVISRSSDWRSPLPIDHAYFRTVSLFCFTPATHWNKTIWSEVNWNKTNFCFMFYFSCAIGITHILFVTLFKLFFVPFAGRRRGPIAVECSTDDWLQWLISAGHWTHWQWQSLMSFD